MGTNLADLRGLTPHAAANELESAEWFTETCAGVHRLGRLYFAMQAQRLTVGEKSVIEAYRRTADGDTSERMFVTLLRLPASPGLPVDWRLEFKPFTGERSYAPLPADEASLRFMIQECVENARAETEMARRYFSAGDNDIAEECRRNAEREIGRASGLAQWFTGRTSTKDAGAFQRRFEEAARGLRSFDDALR